MIFFALYLLVSDCPEFARRIATPVVKESLGAEADHFFRTHIATFWPEQRAAALTSLDQIIEYSKRSGAPFDGEHLRRLFQILNEVADLQDWSARIGVTAELEAGAYFIQNGFDLLGFRIRVENNRGQLIHTDADWVVRDRKGQVSIVEVKNSFRKAIKKRFQIKKLNNLVRKIFGDQGIEISKVFVYVSEGFSDIDRRQFERHHPDEDIQLVGPR